MINKLMRLTLLLLSSAAMAQNASIDSTHFQTLRIDPQSARGTAVSQLFDEVEFIPLETTKESLFGSISKLEVIDGNYIVFDYDTRSVYFFDATGKYKTKISAKLSLSKEDQKDIEFYGFQPVKEEGKSFLAMYGKKGYFIFDMEGRLVKKVDYEKAKFDAKYQFPGTEIKVLPYYEHIVKKDTSTYQLAYVKDKDTVGYFPRVRNVEYVGNNELGTVANDKNVFLHRNLYDFNIYALKPDTISLKYRIIFPAVLTIPKDFIRNKAYGKRFDYLIKNKDLIYGLSNLYQIGDLLYLKADCFNWDQAVKKSLVYNLKSQELISLQDIEPDAKSYFLPVNDATGSFYDFNNRGFNLYNEGYLYTSYSSLAMFTFREQNAAKKTVYPPPLDQYFKTQNKKSNPILVKLKPKTSI